MGIGFTDSQNYANIADAIRYKSGGSNTYTPANMAAAIRAIPGGGGTPTLQDKTVTPSTAPQTVGYDSGYDGLNTVTVLGDDNLVAENIKKNVTIFGTIGDFLGDVTHYSIRPDAALISSYGYDKWVAAEASVTLPTYTTTATTVIASENLSPTITLDMDNYTYTIAIQGLAIPSYTNTTKLKGYVDYSITAGIYEITNTPANKWYTISGSAYSSRNNTVYASGLVYKMLYYSNATTFTVYTASSYGIHQICTAPSLSSATTSNPTLTIKTPTLYMRGSATYFATGVWGKLSDIRRQYKIHVFRSPKNNLSYDGWSNSQQILHILEDAKSSTHTLT